MRKLQNNLYITREGAYIHKERETIVIEKGAEKLLQIPVHSISGIYCFGNMMISPQLMGFCGERGINLAFFNPYGRFLARIQGLCSGNVLLRKAQYRMSEKHPLDIARNIVAAKVQSSKQTLLRHLRNHGENESVKEQISPINRVIQRLKTASDLDMVRGLEGEAAARYFSVFNCLVVKGGDDFVFAGRNRRPPLDPINAMLSFVNSVVAQDISAALQGVGLDPQIGFLHKDRPGRDSLAQDLLEELRSFLVDRLVLTLINRQQIKVGDFTTEISGAVRLNDTSRKLILQSLQARKQDTILHPFLGEEVEIGLVPHIQALLLARHLRGDMSQYPPFVAR